MTHKQPTKPIVHYRPEKTDQISVGHRAIVYPVDHTSPWVSNTNWCTTSNVISYDEETGEFETLNSIYKPVKENENV